MIALHLSDRIEIRSAREIWCSFGGKVQKVWEAVIGYLFTKDGYSLHTQDGYTLKCKDQ